MLNLKSTTRLGSTPSESSAAMMIDSRNTATHGARKNEKIRSRILGVFALASRRYPECHTLGGASLGYVALLYAVGRPQLMLSYAFGGAWVALLLVLMVGLVRWGRRQP